MTPDTVTREPGAIESDRKRPRAQLQAELDRVQAEIRNYPLPIPACDAYFNHLLEERGRLTDELTRLDAPARGG